MPTLFAGFLPSEDPLTRLPQEEFQPWEELADTLPSLLDTGQARESLEKLSVLPIGMLQNKEERMRALLILSVLAHAYVWGEPDKPRDWIPK
ncbi:unnamed protein product, partial [Discosporangium mesarthrocarpum]